MRRHVIRATRESDGTCWRVAICRDLDEALNRLFHLRYEADAKGAQAIDYRIVLESTPNEGSNRRSAPEYQ